MNTFLTRERLLEIIVTGPDASGAEQNELARIVLAAMDSEPVAYTDERNLGYIDRGRDTAYLWGKQNSEAGDVPLYRHAQQPVVDADDNFYSWFGREWQENYQHNQYTTSAKQMLGVMAESAWKAGHRAAMLQSGNSPVIPGWIPVSEQLPEECGRYWCYVEEQTDLGKSHYQWNCSWNGERWWVEGEDGGIVTHWMPLPAAPQEVK